MKKKDPPRSAAKTIVRASRYDDCAEVLAHLEAECERTGHKLTSKQQGIFYELQNGPSESALALMHAWWCYDLEKLLAQMPHTRHPKPRISLSIWMNQRGTLIVSWRPTLGHNLKDSDFQSYPYIPDTREDRLIEVREFRFVTVFHQRPEAGSRPSGFDYRADVSENRLASNALLLQAAAALIKELKARLSYCFQVTMIEDVYFEWQPDGDQKWDFRGTIKYWEIKNVAALEKEEGLKLLDAFELTHGCSLTEFIDVVFGPDKKRPTGPAPSAHTKIDRSARRFKALGHRKLTPSVITRYVGLLRTYRAELLPAEERPPTNVVPLRPK